MDGPEPQLVARAQRGEVAAFQRLIESYASALERVLTRVLDKGADAEEATKDAFFRAWLALPDYDSDIRFSTWLYRIALRETTRRRADDDRGTPDVLDENGGDLPDLSASMRQEAGGVQDFVERCVAKLPAHHRAAVVLRDIEGLSNEEAAYVLGLEVSAFKSRLHTGRMAIRRRLERFYSAADMALAVPTRG